MIKLTEIIVREELREAALKEWGYMTAENKAFVSYLYSLKKKVGNPNNSAVLAALGITEEHDPERPGTYIRGTMPDSKESPR